MLYASYGSNMNLEQMAFRCPHSVVVGNGKLERYKLVFNIHLDVVKGGETDVVPLVIWDIDKRDLINLDRYEGYPLYYIKDLVNVTMDSGEEITALIYIMAENRKGVCPPYQHYFNTCYTGYVENGLDTKYLYDALSYSWENETEYNQYNVKGE